MKAKKILFFCCLLGGQLLAMEEKPSQALAVKSIHEEVSDLAKGLLSKISELNFTAKGLIRQHAFEVEQGFDHREENSPQGFAVEEPNAERDLDKKLLKKILDFLNKSQRCLDGMASAAMEIDDRIYAEHKAKVSFMWVILEPEGSILLTLLFGTGLLCQESLLNPDTFDGYQRGLSKLLHREVAREEVLGLLKKRIDDLEGAKGSPFLGDALKCLAWDKEKLDSMIRVLKSELSDLTEAETKSSAAVVGNS